MVEGSFPYGIKIEKNKNSFDIVEEGHDKFND